MKMRMLHAGKTPKEIKAWIEDVSNVVVTGITLDGEHAVVYYYEVSKEPEYSESDYSA